MVVVKRLKENWLPVLQYVMIDSISRHMVKKYLQAYLPVFLSNQSSSRLAVPEM